MAGRKLEIVTATKSAVLTKSGFANYDMCLNPYVGCQFGCTYCYVRFFVKDQLPWGEFLRIRKHLKYRLPTELKAAGPIRLVIGTMTDPYQPQELEYRLTRSSLEIIRDTKAQVTKLGIFTRSPLVKQDLDLIKSIPNSRIHFTITPFEPEILKRIEPVAVATEARFRTVKQIKEAGIRVHVNVAPAIPLVSEQFIQPFAEKLAEIGVDEFFVDPMQPYKESMKAFEAAMQGDPRWATIEDIMTNSWKYSTWKANHQQEWVKAWRAVASKSPHTLALAQDHQYKKKTNMVTGEELPWDHEDVTAPTPTPPPAQPSTPGIKPMDDCPI